MHMFELLNKRTYQLAAVVILTFLAYSNIFQNQFVLDDYDFIVKWDLVKDLHNLPKIFRADSIPEIHRGVYRPVKTLLLILSYNLWGLNLTFYHLYSLTIHLISTILVYLIILKITKTKFIALVGGAIFGVHPIHTEAITFILASFDSFGLACYLAAFYLFLKSKDHSKRSNLLNYYFLAAVLLATLAFFSYELTLTLPLMLTWYELVFAKKKVILKAILKAVWPFWLSVASYLYIRFFIVHILNRTEYLAGSFYLTMLVMAKSFLKYIILLVLPHNLSIDYQLAPNVSSIVDLVFVSKDKLKGLSFFNPDVLISLLSLVILVLIIIKTYRQNRIISFVIGWFLISLIPVLNLIPQHTLFADRYVYLGSFSFSLLVGLGAYNLIKLAQQKSWLMLRSSVYLSLILLLILYSLLTYQRNLEWKDNLVVWSKLVEQIPNDAVISFQTAQVYRDFHQPDLAIYYFKRTLMIEPLIPEAYYYIGQIYDQKGQHEQAVKYYLKTLKLYPSDVEFIISLENLKALISKQAEDQK